MSNEHSAFRPVPRTGVIYVTTEAQKRGFSPTRPRVVQPRPGPARDRASCPARPRASSAWRSRVDDQEYAPVAGLWELREAIASLYNALYRRGMPSQYSAENVCVSGGGRAALTRAAASLGHVNLGHFLPDYTAYEELLDIFKAFTAIPILLEGERGYAFSADDLRREILGRGLGGDPDEQPVQPDGQAGRGRRAGALGGDGARARLHAAARRVLLALHLPRAARAPAGRERGALRRGRRSRSGRHLRRPHEELALPGLARHLGARPRRASSRRWRAPARSSTAAGASRCSARRSRSSPRTTSSAETQAIQTAFRAKRDYLLSQLERLGRPRRPRARRHVLRLGLASSSSRRRSTTAWASSARRSKRRSSSCPGEFFDVNPGKRRQGRSSRFKGYVRFSFGPPMPVLERAMQRLRGLVGAKG